MRNKLYFPNSRGDRLCGVLSAQKASGDDPLVVLCHGFSTGKDGRTYLRLEEMLGSLGIAIFRFDFFGHGESEGDFAELTVSEAVDDVTRAVRTVKELGYHDIGLLGSSFGGQAALLAAARCPGVRYLVLKSPVSDYLSRLIADRDPQSRDLWQRQGFILITDEDGRSRRLNYSFFTDAARIRGYDAVSGIDIPTLIVHGDRDESVPVAQSRRLAEMLPDCRLEILPGADHRYSRPEDFERMLDICVAFIRAHTQ